MRFTAKLKFNNLNPRREKAGEDPGDLAADLKLVGDVKINDLRPLFQTDHGFAMLEGMYDAEGNLRSVDIATLVLSCDLQSYRVNVSAGDVKIKFDGADLNQIHVVPAISRTAKLSLRVQLHPTENQFAVLATLLSSEVKLIVEEVQGSLFASGPPAQDEDDGDDEGEPGKKKGDKPPRALQ